jgi:hypothetical protein
MSGEAAESQKIKLTAAIAEGMSVALWAERNGVPERTAYRWASEPAVRAEIDLIRRIAFDQAIGRLAARASWAVEGIIKLAENAASESVRLAALRAVMSEFKSGSDFAALETRVAQLEEQLRAHAEDSR